MNKRLLIVILSIATFLVFNPVKLAVAENVRKPAVSGSFYPSKASELREMIKGFLDKATKEKIIGNYSYYRTPLGDVPVDKTLVERLIKEKPKFRFLSSGA
jgi:predicted class III extradiol MEMO1 family dioxygenase